MVIHDRFQLDGKILGRGSHALILSALDVETLLPVALKLSQDLDKIETEYRTIKFLNNSQFQPKRHDAEKIIKAYDFGTIYLHEKVFI